MGVGMSVRKSAWVFGVPGYLTIAYESGKWTRQERRHVSGANPRSGFGIGGSEQLSFCQTNPRLIQSLWATKGAVACPDVG